MHIGDVYGLARSRERLAFLASCRLYGDFVGLIATARISRKDAEPQRRFEMLDEASLRMANT